MTLQSWLEENPFTLSLSSGYFGFFAHAGFMKALEECGLSPCALTGSSAGAIVAGAAAVGLRAKEIEDLFLGVRREDFWDPSPGLGLVRGRRIERLVAGAIGSRFESAQKPLRIATFDILKRRTEIFTTGDLAKAVRASCAVPLMFHPVRIGRSLYWDGGILDKMALSGVAPDEKVLAHYLQGDNRYELCERRRDQKSWSKNRQVLVLKNLARSGPYKLHLGPEILASAYRQTRLHLREKI